jgi:S1-C subfamily serine protease
VSASQQLEVRGSGVIINSGGNILTNRHVIEQPESQTSITGSFGNTIPITVDYSLDRCDVGQLAAGASLPTIPQIQSINPYVNIPVLGYTAQPVFVSPAAGLSVSEIQYADFAVLQITGLSQSGPTFGVTSIPQSFPYAQLLPIKQYPKIDGQVVTYGFPGDVTSGQGNFFQTLTMTGSVGSVTSVAVGDRFYANVPLLIKTDMGIAHGRSGSPLFWRGYVIGLVTFFIGDNQTDSGSVASDAILKGLEGTNYIRINN